MSKKQTKQCFKSAINDLKPPHNQLNIINFPEISPVQSYNSNKNKLINYNLRKHSNQPIRDKKFRNLEKTKEHIIRNS